MIYTIFIKVSKYLLKLDNLIFVQYFTLKYSYTCALKISSLNFRNWLEDLRKICLMLLKTFVFFFSRFLYFIHSHLQFSSLTSDPQDVLRGP